MMSLFFVLSCFLLAMVPTAFGNHETARPLTSPPFVANISVDGDKSVTLKVTTVTYISAKNSTTVVPILTLSTVVEEIAQESVAGLTVPASPASETTSAPTPSDKPSVHVRDWNAAERTRRVSPSNTFTTLYGARKPSNPTNGPPITRAIRDFPFLGKTTLVGTREPSSPTNGPPITRTIRDFPFLGKTTLVGTREPSTMTHGNRIRENPDGMDPIQARSTLSTSTSTTLPPVPDAETPSALNLEPKGSDMENKDKAENVYLVLKEDSFGDFLKHVICFFDVYCDDDATDEWKRKKKIFEDHWMVEPIAAATAKTAGPTPDPSSMATTSLASYSSPTSTPTSASSAPTLDQDPEPHAKRSNNTDNADNIVTNEMGNMNVNVSHATEGFWDGVAEGAHKFFDGVAEGASEFPCWFLPFTCHH
ncbi:hypothetical protein GE21DRAFT_2613 [Neurospora crassa]|uniref:Uncharacterized protein n=1 Tax=Neurospora crassa (strain ATCC 24698 / 74-OR23-1A / CBS 708.71 / DSM 1257 / FGSC 987) TaxID=367110 RepID=Q7SFJ2_NEUCR|nr:hypothetical protein NCU08629 [Neurospora crassa OR74A]EAA35601.2 hypothetical protein NCU08629 [Neurospora crassa OR74A]KHE81228.1 hypothetical protein GE21DRAFT_2613 [Neurospora crassa]|eukprot:XP_964837.2 hypothetical protein NCU08629 [Neurospora crassa OR74A]